MQLNQQISQLATNTRLKIMGLVRRYYEIWEW